MIKNSVIYTLVSVLNKGLSLLLLPVLTYYLLPADYGMLSLVQLIISFTFPIQNLNGNLYFSKNYFTIDKIELDKYIGIHLKLVLWLTLILSVTFLILYPIYLQNFQISWYWYILIFFSGVFNSIYLNYLTILRCQENIKKYAFFELIKTSVNALLSVFLVSIIFTSWEGRVLAIIIVTIVFGLIALLILIKGKEITMINDSQINKDILNFTLPLIPFSLGMFVINLSDRLFIEYYMGLDSLGFYSVSYTLGMLVLLVAESFNKAWYPTFFKKMKDYKQNRRFIISVILGFSVFLLTIPPILYLISRYLIFPYFIDSSYITSLNFILGIGFSYVFYGYYLILYPFLAWKNKTKIMGAIFTIAAIINLILNGIMIPFYGLNGAIFSTIITYFAMTVLVLIAVVRIDYSNEDSFKNS
jgi:O-antigen/teichoic acid export membrane protein